MTLLVRRNNYKDERKCPVCKKIVKPSCKGHEGIPYSVYRMIEVKLAIKKRKNTLYKKIDEKMIVNRRATDDRLVNRMLDDAHIMPSFFNEV